MLEELDVEALLRPSLSFASCDKVWGFSAHGNVGLLYPIFQGVLVSHWVSFEMLVTIYLTSFPSVFMRALVFSSCIRLFEDSTDYSRRCRLEDTPELLQKKKDSEQLEYSCQPICGSCES